MIEPNQDDIGRKAVYRPHYGAVEEGPVTSFNDHYVFVRYGSDAHSKATRRQDLEWASPTPVRAPEERT